MVKDIFVMVAMIAFLGAPTAQALHCYQCFGCETATKVECNDQAVADINNAVDKIFHIISTEKSDKFDCITLAYLTDNSHAKMQGCVYNTPYACSLKPRNYSVVYICGTCDSDYCNSSTRFSDVKIAFTLLATLFVASVARILFSFE